MNENKVDEAWRERERCHSNGLIYIRIGPPLQQSEREREREIVVASQNRFAYATVSVADPPNRLPQRSRSPGKQIHRKLVKGKNDRSPRTR